MKSVTTTSQRLVETSKAERVSLAARRAGRGLLERLRALPGVAGKIIRAILSVRLEVEPAGKGFVFSVSWGSWALRIGAKLERRDRS